MSVRYLRPVRVVEPTKKRARVADIWRSRRVARVLAARDLKVKYKQSLLGPPWLVLQPLGILGALIVAFHGVAKVNTSGVPYVPFALVGLVVWTLVQTSLLIGTQSLLVNQNLIRRVASDRISFVVGSLLSNLIGPAVIVAGAIVALLVTGTGLPLQALVFPLIAVWLLAFTFALVCVFASLAVRFRDVQTLLPFWSQAGLFLTPVGYSLSNAPGHTYDVLVANPLTGLLEVTRWSLLGTHLPLAPVLVSAGFTVFVLWAGWEIYARMEVTFADVI
jgi:lipopolysaccharide transport system permease protein